MDNYNEEIMQLHQEQLDIVKKWVKNGEVKIHSEIISEEKNITVSLKKEVLVIEKIKSDKSNNTSDVIRIPIRQEDLEIVKHPVALEEVSVYVKEIQDIVNVDEKIRKEDVKIDSNVNEKIIYSK
ncbi:YsnF/AvaK domain-containing protein [Clostridium sp. 'White wine YQ']|uniref:YsnF/AvaK domain-containing protein n=1 Tax=Clostridium sp. 'White wine YQ' TaxID=3027474 RepID=UPI0023657610|nr:YsnF/AvaK domain-containing protein [Clostridium sp. 'White wine YQ']MDD7793605.1 YsnF/AvaK domain-containing protein [Clostridium sp. 'White wine YQ']